MTPLLRDRRLWTIFSVTIMAIMGVSSVMSTLPLLSRGLGFPIEDVGKVITFFTLPGLIFTPVAGMLADRYGRKRVLIPALLLFCAGGLACGFATNLNMLLAFRAVQGLGAAPLGALQATLVADLYTGRERGTVMGLNSSMLSLGTAILPAFGGLVAIWGWDKPFLLPLFALPVAWACLRLPLPGAQPAGGMGSYLRSTLSIMTRRSTLLLFLLPFLSFCLFYGPMVTFFPVLTDSRFSAPAHHIGLMFASASAGAALAAIFTGRLAARFGSKSLVLIAPIFYALGLAGVPLMPGFLWLIAPVFCFGVGQGLMMPNISLLLTHIAPPEQRAVVMSLFGWMLRAGQTISPLMATAIFTRQGLDAIFHAGALLTILQFALALVLLKVTLKSG